MQDTTPSAYPYAHSEENDFTKVKLEVSMERVLDDALERGSNGRHVCRFEQMCIEKEKGTIVALPPNEKYPWDGFFCHRCKTSGSVIDLYMHRFGLDDLGAMLRLAAEHNVAISEKGGAWKKEQARKERAEKYLDPALVETRAGILYDRLCDAEIESIDTSSKAGAARKDSAFTYLWKCCRAAAKEQMLAERQERRESRVSGEFSRDGTLPGGAA